MEIYTKLVEHIFNDIINIKHNDHKILRAHLITEKLLDLFIKGKSHSLELYNAKIPSYYYKLMIAECLGLGEPNITLLKSLNGIRNHAAHKLESNNKIDVYIKETKKAIEFIDQDNNYEIITTRSRQLPDCDFVLIYVLSFLVTPVARLDYNLDEILAYLKTKF